MVAYWYGIKDYVVYMGSWVGYILASAFIADTLLRHNICIVNLCNS